MFLAGSSTGLRPSDTASTTSVQKRQRCQTYERWVQNLIFNQSIRWFRTAQECIHLFARDIGPDGFERISRRELRSGQPHHGLCHWDIFVDRPVTDFVEITMTSIKTGFLIFLDLSWIHSKIWLVVVVVVVGVMIMMTTITTMMMTTMMVCRSRHRRQRRWWYDNETMRRQRRRWW